MRELDLFNLSVDGQTLSKHAKRAVSELVMAHVENLEVALAHQRLLDWLHMLVSQSVANKIKFADRNNHEQL